MYVLISVLELYNLIHMQYYPRLRNLIWN